MSMFVKMNVLNEKGKNLIRLKADYEKIPQGIMREASKEGLEKILKKDYTPAIIRAFFELDSDSLLDKMIKSKTMIRCDSDILKEEYDKFKSLDLVALDKSVLNGYQENDFTKTIKNTLKSNITSGGRTIFIENLHKVQLVENDGIFYILKKAGLRYTTFRTLKGTSDELFRNVDFMTNLISAYYKGILKINLDENIVLSDVVVNEKSLKYNFDVLIPLSLLDTAETIKEKVLKLNIELYNLGIL